MITAILFFLLKKNLDFYATMWHISINTTGFTNGPSGKCDHRRTHASFQAGLKNQVCKNEEQLLERLHQAIMDLSNNPEKTQQTTAIGTLF